MNVLRIDDECGIATIHELHRRAVECAARGEDCVVDFAGARRIDCAVLQIIIALRRACAVRGVRCMVTNANDVVLNLLSCGGIRWRRMPQAAESAGAR